MKKDTKKQATFVLLLEILLSGRYENDFLRYKTYENPYFKGFSKEFVRLKIRKILFTSAKKVL